MLEPGIYENVSAEEYHRHELGVVSKSALDQVHRSPSHYRAWVDGTLPFKETDSLWFGRAFHCALLEPAKFEAHYITAPKFEGKGSRAAKLAWEQEHAGFEPIDMDDLLAITRMVEAVKNHPLASKMIRDGKPELTLSWKDESTGLRCKSRLDYYVRDLSMIVDAKSSDDASWDSFRRDVAKYGYHRQDALYRAAAIALDLPVQHFVLLAVEKTEPHAIALYTLDADAVGRGYSSVRQDIETLAACMKSGRFHGYPETIQELPVPPWAA